ncbi:His/Glu/Gln/Arg/opine family amino acid ABC transporter permease subunit [Mesorhizobium loti]|uniref:His/Glu/Gln/Arg/opine family amino acid ABC transporter permease subunit n=1 Tax=Rhizobium loti TaxID=381 RepID=A0A8E3B1W3_RHILI|nr:ABC transporter permease subunit [Mesorhizobium loti]PWJ84724.1 His/Glu/Gln/Arg/opine family amino acid ABC transporter permease subunit [Mesorhizobium loti]
MYALNFGPVLSNFEELMQGLWTTIYLSVSAMILGLLVSIVCAVGKTSGGRLVVAPINLYIELIRNTPFLVQIFIIYFSLPVIGFRMSPNTAALTALVVNVGAYGTVIIRAGIDSIQRGQIEAGHALGLSRGLRKVSMYTLASDGLSSEWENVHRDFHFTIVSACSSSWLIRFHELLWDQAARYRHLSSTCEFDPSSTITEHQMMVDALLKRDSIVSIDLSRRHIVECRLANDSKQPESAC